ncbi:hypothetical protein BJX61DRAFT_539715 [Aspergillus egyptiacus]|nr:hypothetical protein BJX61DRAFT_539715 [Aspergillus egyptiacus]
MSVVVVAGGLGDMGRLITQALCDTGKHEVYIMSRQKLPLSGSGRRSPLTSKQYQPFIQTDYSNQADLTSLLEQYHIDTVICAFSLDFESASLAQLTLIRAAEAAASVKRFIPSEFNVDYDLPDSILPYPDKRLHTVARRELEKTTLEFSYVYCGLFMDYFAMPYIRGDTRALYLVLDAANRVALIPGDGERPMAVSHTHDVASYLALAVGLDSWPRVMTVVAGSLSCNELAALAEMHLDTPLHVTYQPVSSLLAHENATLPGNVAIAAHFPGGLDQVKALTADLETSIALGAYDFKDLGDHLDLVARFSEQRQPIRIEEFLKRAFERQK